MNHIAFIERNGSPRVDVVIDGRKLQEHFVGRSGGHPAQVFALGWKNVQIAAERESIDQFLAQRLSTLLSGRVPILVCQECGDIGCGAIAAWIERHGLVVNWSDWVFENGYEPARPLDWSTYPQSLQFDCGEYERAFAGAFASG
jgi:hypothetical protein